MAYLGIGNIFDAITGKSAFIDRFRNLRTAHTKRIVGSNFGSSIDTTYLYTTSVAGAGTVTASNGVATLATGTTANGAASIVTKTKIRYLSGRNNLDRYIFRFPDTGTANNVREIGVFIDANNSFGIRLSGTTFSCFFKKAGVDNVVNSGSFNGNGSGSGGSFTVDTNFHALEILVSGMRTTFIMDDVALTTFTTTTTSLITSLAGVLYVSNTNSGGSTTNVTLDLLAVSGNQLGSAVNNPLYYNIDAVAETRTLKGGAGTLQSITIGSLGGASAKIILYDNASAASGTKIITFDLTANAAFGTHICGIEGVVFTNGLTYITSGTMTNASVTLYWE